MIRNRELFWRLVEPEHSRIRAFCRKLTGNRDDGDDLYQDALIRGLESFGNLRDEKAFKGWLYRIIVNTFKNRVRKPWYGRIVSLISPDDLSLPCENPSGRYTARRQLDSALKTLPAADRALIVLFEIEGWSIRELAETWESSEGAIKVRLSRARAKLRNHLVRSLSGQNSVRNRKPSPNEDSICVVPKPSAD